SLINMINSEQGECHECGNVNPEQIFNIIETKVVNEYGNFTDERKVLPENWNQYFDENTQLPEIEPSHEYPPSSLNIPSRIKQTIIFATRDIKSKLSNKQYLLINLLEAPILAFVLAYIIKYHNTDNLTNVGYVFSKNINMPAYLFMSVIVALFMGLTVSAEEIIRDRKILKREEFLNLSRSSYLFSKISILFTLSAIQTFTFVLVGNFILEVNEMLFIYWLILFTTSCMANVLGLNISSAFNTAVTIYILIPILLIPQLILSGVVVKFDKLNPSLSNTGKVPIVGDVMASRWAFEAAMVAQFKDNPFESQFYFLDKRNAESDYKKIYYIPELESNLEYCYNNSKSTDPKVVQNMENSFELLRNEIQHEMVDLNLNQEKFPQLDSLNIGTFSPTVYSKTLEFLSTLRRFYSRQQKEADEQRDKIMVSLTNTAEKREEFQQMKNEYLNESISEIVKNSNEAQRIIKADNRLYQKIYPIYMTPKPTHMFDYRTEFYVPVKHFMGRYFDTVYFNIVVIWIMSVTLIITLYFDVFRKILDFLGNLFTSKKY
ncbi:MAG: ABC transporter permease, partial [Cyclobacteriaceae bacterium]|nr:ABC transporter permease [Cyclobacteriaceae bacterium]